MESSNAQLLKYYEEVIDLTAEIEKHINQYISTDKSYYAQMPYLWMCQIPDGLRVVTLVSDNLPQDGLYDFKQLIKLDPNSGAIIPDEKAIKEIVNQWLPKPNEQQFSDDSIVYNAIEMTLNTITGRFDQDELAFLSLQGKNETQIRDKIAWRLHNLLEEAYPNQYLVVKEWKPEHIKGRERVDLAILKMNQNGQPANVVAMIEFKAQSIVRQESWYLNEYAHDMVKMRLFAEKNLDINLYFVFLMTGQKRVYTDKDPYAPMLAFLPYMSGATCGQPNELHKQMSQCFKAFPTEGCCSFERKLNHKTYGFKLLQEVPTNLNEFEVQELGTVHNFTNYLGAFIWGPVAARDIDITKNGENKEGF